MSFDLSKLGRWSKEHEFKVDAEQTKAYAAATNDDNPKHVSGELAPPLFAVVPLFETAILKDCMTGIVPEKYALTVVHGEQDIYLHHPIKPGMVLRMKGVPVGVHVKPTGTTLVLRVQLHDESDTLINEQYFTAFFRGAKEGNSAGETAPERPTSQEAKTAAPVATVTQHLDEDQTFRYSPASGDKMIIHLDDAAAKSVGLPGIIIHGMCTMAFNSRAVIASVCGNDPARLKRIAVRFSKIVLPGQDITTRIWAAGERDGRKIYAFETSNPDGELVIKDGLAEVRK